jgi:hypothetical protein
MKVDEVCIFFITSSLLLQVDLDAGSVVQMTQTESLLTRR